MTVYPEQRLPWLVFGEGSQGQILSRKEDGVNEDGVKMVKVKFRPTEELLSLYGIPRTELDHEYSLTRRYKKSNVITLSDDPVNATVLIMCDVKGGNTPMTDLYGHILDTLEGYEKRINSLQSQNAWLHAEMKKMSTHLRKYIEENAEMFMSAIKVRGDIDNPFAGYGAGEE